MTYEADLAIVGSGFGASILAMIARRLDLRVVLIERGRHPRFAIGESASPLAGVLIEELADRYELPRLRPLAQFGDWQRAYPGIGCGLKRGFTFFKHEDGRRYRRSPGRSDELLVAASPTDALADTHWLRSDVDHFLVREAESLGAEYLDRVALHALEWDAGGRPTLGGDRHGRAVRIRARFVIDGSGARGFLSGALPIVDRGFPLFPRTQALFSHFTGVARCDEMDEYRHDPAEPPPYAIDDAALHHVFDGGWMWVLRFGNGVTSAGIAATDGLAQQLRLADGEAAWRRLLARHPSIGAQFARAQPIREFTWMPRLAFRAAQAAGPGWATLPSAAGFVDPLFSTGLPLTLLGVERLAALLERRELAQGDRAMGPGVRDYAAATFDEVDHTARFIAGCYAAFPRFETFAAYSMFYFAAASFSEAARRLRAPGRPRRFMCADHPEFAGACVQLSPALAGGVGAGDYARAVARAVDPLNVAGLSEPAKRNWYGVDPQDTVRSAAKLAVGAADVVAMFERLGLTPPCRLRE